MTVLDNILLIIVKIIGGLLGLYLFRFTVKMFGHKNNG